MLKKLLWSLLGEARFITVEQLYEAVGSGSLAAHQEQPEGFSDSLYFSLTNEQASVKYRETNKAGGKHVETLDMISPGKPGGVIATFTNDELVELTHNARKRDVRKISETERQNLWQILLKVRHALSV